jgi:hypothetical protein
VSDRAEGREGGSGACQGYGAPKLCRVLSCALSYFQSSGLCAVLFAEYWAVHSIVVCRRSQLVNGVQRAVARGLLLPEFAQYWSLQIGHRCLVFGNADLKLSMHLCLGHFGALQSG